MQLMQQAGAAGVPIPGATPNLDVIQQQAQEKFDEAGMGKVEEFTKQLQEIVANANCDEFVSMAQMQVDKVKNKFQGAIDDPSTLAPTAGPMVAVASWYAQAVSTKLGSVNDEASELVAAVGGLVGKVQEPLKDLSVKLKEAMSKLEGSVQNLAGLPKLMKEACEGKTSAEQISQIDCSPMKLAVQTGDVNEPLDLIIGLKDILQSALDTMISSTDTVKGFSERAPSMVKAAFDVPQPLCFLTSCAQNQAPQFLQDALEMLEKVKEIDLQPVVDMLQTTMSSLCNLDVNMVKEPVSKFLESGREIVEKLEQSVEAAKLLCQAQAASTPPAATKKTKSGSKKGK